MISIRKILIPTDFSDHSSKALTYGQELAIKFGASLELLHIVETTPVLYAEGGVFPFETAQELVQAATSHLDQVNVDIGGDQTVSRKVIEGTPFVEIVQYAKEQEVDLIVIGTHGRGAIAHMLMGSVAEKVVRKAPCPVLVVRDEEHDFVMP